MIMPDAKGWKPRLALSDALKAVLQAIAAREMGRQDQRQAYRDARSKIETALAQAFPDHRLEVRPADKIKRAIHGDMSFVVFVDGLPDQGLIFGVAKEDGTFYGAPANRNNAQRG